MEIIDGQLHEPGLQRYWDTTPVETQHAVLSEAMHAQLRAVGVDGAVLHPVEDASWAHGLADREPRRFAVVRLVARPQPELRRWDAIDPDAPDVEAELTAAAACPGFAAFRLGSFTDDDLPVGRGGGQDAVLRYCAEHAIPVFSPFGGSPRAGGAVARAYPDLPVVLDQLTFGPVVGRAADPWARLSDVLALAALPNVFLKLTGLPACSRVPFPYPDLRAPVREVLDRFGAHRCFWASDLSYFQGQIGWAHRFPALVGEYPGKHTYAQAVGFWRDAGWLTHEEREWLLGATVRGLLAWPKAEGS